MGRIFIIVVSLGLILGAAAVLGLGAFPPDPKPQTIQHTLSNDRFKN